MKATEEYSRNGKVLRQCIPSDAAGMTLEQYLKNRMHFTRAQIRGMKFRENGLVINGRRVRVTHVLQSGERLEIRLEEAQRTSDQLETTAGELEILYEDCDLIAVWKEAGLVLHPAHGHYQDTLSNRLHGYFQGKNEAVMIRSIGRLDRDTAGIVLFAKNQVAAARLWKQKEDGLFTKEYLALCSGAFPDEEWHTIDRPIGNMDGELMKMCVTPEGKRAVTHYQAIEVIGADTLIRVHIETGRTHQIRVHMASIGHPLVGDILYGREEEKGQAPMQLTAWRVKLRQPFTEEPMEISRSTDK